MNARIIQIEQPVRRINGRPKTSLQTRVGGAPRIKSRVEQAFRMMGTWGNSSPECSLYDLARMGR